MQNCAKRRNYAKRRNCSKRLLSAGQEGAEADGLSRWLGAGGTGCADASDLKVDAQLRIGYLGILGYLGTGGTG